MFVHLYSKPVGFVWFRSRFHIVSGICWIPLFGQTKNAIIVLFSSIVTCHMFSDLAARCSRRTVFFGTTESILWMCCCSVINPCVPTCGSHHWQIYECWNWKWNCLEITSGMNRKMPDCVDLLFEQMRMYVAWPGCGVDRTKHARKRGSETVSAYTIFGFHVSEIRTRLDFPVVFTFYPQLVPVFAPHGILESGS